MNGAHWHLVVNHFPIISPLVGAMILITGLIFKSEPVKRTACMIFIIGALTSIVAMTTGEGAEEVVEKLNGVTENYIEQHEESAETFAILSYILGGISLLGLWVSFKQKAYSNIVAYLTLVLAIGILFFAQQTGTTGGEIRHTEIRNGTSAPAIESNKAEGDD